MTRIVNCIFCNTPLRGKRSKEHIFPQWLQKYLGIKKQYLHHTIYTVNGEIEHVRKQTFNGHVSGLICSVCNTGWLSQLEGQSKPILIPLLDGSQNGSINQAQCEVIAKWFYKTALVLHSAAMQKKFIPAEHFTCLYQEKQIPKGVFIAIAPICKKDEEDLYWIQNGGWPGRVKGVLAETIKEYLQKSYKITMRAGKLAWRVTYFHQESIPSVNIVEYRNDCVKYIYPCGAKWITWPPTAILDDLSEFDSGLVYLEKREYSQYFSLE